MRFISVLATFTLLLAACDRDHSGLNGKFEGNVDGHVEQSIQAIFYTKGDGITVGKWGSKTMLGDADIDANGKGSVRKYQIVKGDGPCKGRFDVSFNKDLDTLRGNVSGNSSSCPNSSFAFTLKKSL